jgi:hypothetical protein
MSQVRPPASSITAPIIDFQKATGGSVIKITTQTSHSVLQLWNKKNKLFLALAKIGSIPTHPPARSAAQSLYLPNIEKKDKEREGKEVALSLC